MQKIKTWCYKNIKIVILMIAFITITLCSKESFLYPFNDGQDTNIFRTVGKGIVNGLIPYKDLYEQKGPYIYFLFALENYIPNLIYIVEIICCAISLYYIYKILEIYKSNSLTNVFLFSVIVYFSLGFSHGGGTIEEYFFPIMIFLIYKGVLYIKNNIEISNKQFFYIGIMAGIVFWMKYSLVGFFVGWYIALFYMTMKNKGVKYIIKNIFDILFGVVVSTIPVIFYFNYNHAIQDLIYAYFIDNIVTYSSGTNVFINIFKGFLYTGLFNIVISICMICGIASYFKISKNEKFYFLFIFVFLLCGTYGGGRHYLYYFFPFSVFIIFFLMNAKVKKILSITCIVVSLFINLNLPLLMTKYENMPQYKFAKIINEVENPSVLNYNFLDGGFYEAANVLPNNKYFCRLNVGLGVEVMTDDIKNKNVDFYITVDEQYRFDGYTLIEQAEFPYEGVDRTYFLYKKTV